MLEQQTGTFRNRLSENVCWSWHPMAAGRIPPVQRPPFADVVFYKHRHSDHVLQATPPTIPNRASSIRIQKLDLQLPAKTSPAILKYIDVNK